MLVYEPLSEEEKMLVAILLDPSGSELAEFLYEDPNSLGNRYRLWDFQWPYYHCRETLQVDASGRGVGKSVSARLRACAFPFNYPGEDMLITAPEKSHLSLVTDGVEAALLKYRLLRSMLKDGGENAKANGIRQSPHFQATFDNGAKILSRLPGRDGTGVKGPHPLVIELDELQDFPERGFTELTETIKMSEPNAVWRCHGVSNGVGDLHFKLTSEVDELAKVDEDDPTATWNFFVHRYIAPHRPTWNHLERNAKIKLYGGEDNPNYIRNIFGEPGSATNPVFVLARLMACVRRDDVYNQTIYKHITITESDRLRALEQDLEIEELLTIPVGHLGQEYTSYWAGMDVGYTTDPSEVLLYGTTTNAAGKEVDRLLLRLTMTMLESPIQRRLIKKVFDLFGPRLRRWGMDATGNGKPIAQELSHMPDIGKRIAGYGFSEKRTTGFADRPLEKGETLEDLVIVEPVLKFATRTLRQWVDAGNLELPFDQDLLRQWQMMNKKPKSEDEVMKTSGGADHTFDAARMYALAKGLEQIEIMLKKPAKREEVLDAFF